MPWARASALDRHLECPAASWLPRLDRGQWKPGYLESGVFVPPDIAVPDDNRDAAEWGTSMHLGKAAPDRAGEIQRSMMDPWREKLWPTRLGLHEQAVAYDCDTGAVEMGPTNLDDAAMSTWKESRAPSCVVGTCDWWANLPLGEPWVDDLKTGWRTPDVVTPQTLFYLMCKCKVDGADVGRVSITHWPRAADAPTREGLWRQVTKLVLDSFEDDLRRAWKRTVGSREAQPGPWCRFCPSQLDCDRAYE